VRERERERDRGRKGGRKGDFRRRERERERLWRERLPERVGGEKDIMLERETLCVCVKERERAGWHLLLPSAWASPASEPPSPSLANGLPVVCSAGAVTEMEKRERGRGEGHEGGLHQQPQRRCELSPCACHKKGCYGFHDNSNCNK